MAHKRAALAEESIPLKNKKAAFEKRERAMVRSYSYSCWHGYIAIASYTQISKVSYIFISQIVQELMEEPPQDAAISEKVGKNSVEIQVDIPPIDRNAQTQVAPETRHIGRQ